MLYAAICYYESGTGLVPLLLLTKLINIVIIIYSNGSIWHNDC